MEYRWRIRKAIAFNVIGSKPRCLKRAIFLSIFSTTALVFGMLIMSRLEVAFNLDEVESTLLYFREKTNQHRAEEKNDSSDSQIKQVPLLKGSGASRAPRDWNTTVELVKPRIYPKEFIKTRGLNNKQGMRSVKNQQRVASINSNAVTTSIIKSVIETTKSSTSNESANLAGYHPDGEMSCDYSDQIKVDLDPHNVPRAPKDPFTRCILQPPTLIGRFIPVMHATRHDELVAMFSGMQDGGHYTPRMCTPIEKTAIIIPYRNRCRHLYTLLPNLIPMLMRQNVDFTIFVIEQSTPGSFNKGILFNAGYLEALKLDNYDCFILHDVDMIPLDDRNMYKCNNLGPIHFSSALDKFNYSVEYEELFGGVVGFTREQFRIINGASNLYFGWGAEDDDLRNRAVNKKMMLLRKNQSYAFYDMIKHNTSKGFEPNPDRKKIYGSGRARQEIDGLNSVVYNVTSIRTSLLYTWLAIGFDKEAILSTVPEHLRMGKSFHDSFLSLKFKEIA